MAHSNQSHDPTPDVSDEIAITAEHLAVHLRGRLRNVSLTVQRGGVIIHGRTRSYYVKQLAQHAVMKRVSLPIAANEIEVHESGRDVPTLSRLARGSVEAPNLYSAIPACSQSHMPRNGGPG
jgi:hypothetical protein